MRVYTYTAPPTLATFMKSEAFFRIVAGPVGSGKTTACIQELLRRSFQQAKGPDGFRRTRFAIVRQTLQQLKQTVLKDIQTWLEGLVTYKVTDNTIFINIGEVKSEWFLIPLEDPTDQRRLLSMQLTGAWISEAIEIDADLVPALAGRLGRFPSNAQGGPTWFGMVADTNMPAIGSTWWELMDQRTPVDWQVFVQPGGLEPNAENIENLPGGREYYIRLARQHSGDWINRYVNAKYGDDPSGTAVFRSSFKQAFHVVPEILPINGHPLIIGQDFGRNPWAVITQMDHKGRCLVLAEIPAEDIGLELHIQTGLRPALQQARYLGKQAVIIGDPAGAQRSTTYEETSFDVVKQAGFAVYPAPTNNIDARLRSVETFLLEQREGGPAMLFDRERCPTLVRAMNGGYRFAKTKAGYLKPVPDKSHPYSDVADALQYACAAMHGGMMNYITARLQATRKPRERGPGMPSGAWT